ncbi:unnamed protein product, partial [Vitis vinifera]|uniref:Uncharacterized protein n=1 Tax=Vitis vinifera TaxID=29760 RepID=D7TE49_VITVI
MEQIEHKYVEVNRLKLMWLCWAQVLRWCCSCMASLKYGIHGGTKWLPLQPLDTEQLPLILGAMGSPNSLLSLRRRLLMILWLISLELWTVWASVRLF